MTEDRPLLGIILMLGFCVMAPLGDSVAKVLGGQIGLLQLVFLRFLLQALLLAPFILLGRNQWRMSRRSLRLTMIRTILHIMGIGMMFSALSYLPLADAVAIAFVMPFIMLLLGRFVLDETVGARRLIACGVGFIGTLLVVQPAFENVGWPALLPVGVAIVFAFFMLVTRKMAKDIDPVGMQAISGGIAILLLAPLVVLFETDSIAALNWTNPAPATWGLILLMGLFGTVGHLLMTWSLRFAPSATLAPMQYLEIPFATLAGWVIFRDLPNAPAAVGIAITIASGVYILLRERAMSHAIATKPKEALSGPPAAE